jgi:nicotinate-nucleotide adenylyltransferase
VTTRTSRATRPERPAPGSAPERAGRLDPPASVVPGAVGILGGTFDPVHIGHLALADEAREALGLERVLFVPAAAPPHKLDRSITPVEHRLAMVELAIADDPAFGLSRVELERPGPSYTVDTLERLCADAEAAGQSLAPTLILSVESFSELPTWHRYRRIAELARIAVAPRNGRPMPDEAWLEEHLGDLRARIVALDGPNLRISASEIRARVGVGRSVRYLLPLAVSAYMADHALYR